MPKLLWSRRLLGAAVAGVLIAGTSPSPPAWAGKLYRWVTEDGVVSYTDDERRIPPRYQERALLETTESLADYPRLTPADARASADYADRLAARLERLRSANAEAEQGPLALPGARDARSRISLRTGGEQPTVELDVSGDSEGPVVVEVMRLRDSATMATRHVTVVSQGDKILSVVDPRKWMEAPSSGDLQDLIGR